ncbi:MAG: MBL fold metallo-hydrolase RNA specificity domain-containing protein [Nitrososphaeria archaeon]
MLPYGISNIGSNLVIKSGGRLIALDPITPVSTDLIFVSHAHFDHLMRKATSPVIASKETVELATARGVKISTFVHKVDGIKLVDSGHILGSRALIAGKNEIMYTGDFAGRPRGFLGRLEPEHVKNLIIESTYGKKGYSFPSIASVLKIAMDTISRAYDNGLGVSLHGYTLGKAQLISYFFKAWRPLIFDRKVENINKIYRKYGITLPEPDRVVDESTELPNGPYLYVAPMGQRVNSAPVRISFTGWAIKGRNSSLPISDHADHDELINFVKTINPENVVTVHGFDRELAEELRKEGFKTQAFGDQQVDICNFM